MISCTTGRWITLDFGREVAYEASERIPRANAVCECPPAALLSSVETITSAPHMRACVVLL